MFCTSLVSRSPVPKFMAKPEEAMFGLRRTKFTATLALFAVGFLNPSVSFGWGPQGHMMVAYIAWKQMTPETRAQAMALLQALPHKEYNVLKGMPDDLPAERRDMYTFMKASLWPDMIRGQDDPEHAESHTDWHYVDFPINLDGKEGPVPETKLEAGKDPHNALQALQLCEQQLRDPGTPPERKAIALAWVLHVIGDIHQPLHASSVFSNTFPNGDAGGNLFVVDYYGLQTPLHSLWDSLPGLSAIPPVAAEQAESLLALPTFQRAAYAGELQDTTEEGWVKESYRLALSSAYENGALRGANANAIKAGEKPAVPTLRAGYDEDARSIANRRIPLAGYRLADRLKDLLAPAPQTQPAHP